MNRVAVAAALAVESRKTSASRVVIATTVLLVAGIAVLAGSLTLAAANGNEQVLARLGPLADRAGWHLLLGVVAQVTAATALLGLLGLVLGLGPVDAEVAAALGRQHLLPLLSAVLAVPAAVAATLGRGLLPGIATTIGLVVTAQVAVVVGAGAWFPLAAPALWALDPTTVTTTQLALVATVPLLAAPATLTSWHRLQLDR